MSKQGDSYGTLFSPFSSRLGRLVNRRGVSPLGSNVVARATLTRACS